MPHFLKKCSSVPQILTKLQTTITRVLDEQWRIQKQGKLSEFDAEDVDHIKSGPAVTEQKGVSQKLF